MKTLLPIVVLAMSLLLVFCISIDAFYGVDYYASPTYLHIQLIVCLSFLIVFVMEMFLSKRPSSYLVTHFPILLISIPYLNIVDYFNISLPSEVLYLVRFIPLLRGGYALSVVVGWLARSRMSGLFITYIAILFSSIYFSSLVFYVVEHRVNNLVTAYNDAIWWAFMDATTVGSNIVAVTPVGRFLSVFLAALGMMMFPIFTVYITDKVRLWGKGSE